MECAHSTSFYRPHGTKGEGNNLPTITKQIETNAMEDVQNYHNGSLHSDREMGDGHMLGQGTCVEDGKREAGRTRPG